MDSVPVLEWTGLVAFCSSGPWFNIDMSSYQYRTSHCGDKTVVRLSYLHNGISYTGKMASLYWISPLVSLRIPLLHSYIVKCMLMSLLHWAQCALIMARPISSKILTIGFGDNTGLLWWNNVNNQFCQLTTRVSYQRGIRRPFKCTGNHTYWGLKNNWSTQSKNGLQNLWGNTVFFILC